MSIKYCGLSSDGLHTYRVFYNNEEYVTWHKQKQSYEAIKKLFIDTVVRGM